MNEYTCEKCGYHGSEEETSTDRWWHVPAFTVGILALGVVAVWIGVIMTEWLNAYSNETLVEVLKGHWEWITSRRIW
jgi:hypothetical protein